MTLAHDNSKLLINLQSVFILGLLTTPERVSRVTLLDLSTMTYTDQPAVLPEYVKGTHLGMNYLLNFAAKSGYVPVAKGEIAELVKLK